MKKEQGKGEKGAKGKKLKGAGSKRGNCKRSREHGSPQTEARYFLRPPPRLLMVEPLDYVHVYTSQHMLMLKPENKIKVLRENLNTLVLDH